MFIIIGMQSGYCTDKTILTRTGKNSSRTAERYNLITRGQSQSRWVMSDSLKPHGLYSLWNSLGQNTGVGSLFLLQGIFPTQGLNPSLPLCRQIFFNQLSHKRPKCRSFSIGRLLCCFWACFPFRILSLFCSVWLGAEPLQAVFLYSKVNWLPERFGQWEELEGERTVGEINQAHFPLPSAARCNSSGDCIFSAAWTWGDPGPWILVASPPSFVSVGG